MPAHIRGLPQSVEAAARTGNCWTLDPPAAAGTSRPGEAGDRLRPIMNRIAQIASGPAAPLPMSGLGVGEHTSTMSPSVKGLSRRGYALGRDRRLYGHRHMTRSPFDGVVVYENRRVVVERRKPSAPLSSTPSGEVTETRASGISSTAIRMPTISAGRGHGSSAASEIVTRDSRTSATEEVTSGGDCWTRRKRLPVLAPARSPTVDERSGSRYDRFGSAVPTRDSTSRLPTRLRAIRPDNIVIQFPGPGCDGGRHRLPCLTSRRLILPKSIYFYTIQNVTSTMKPSDLESRTRTENAHGLTISISRRD